MVVERAAREGGDRPPRPRAREVHRARLGVEARVRDTILGQLRRLGCSLDWSRLRFTLDPDLSRAVRHAFVQLYEDGLIYRGRYVVNWCPRCETAVSDLEVVHRETDGALYKIRYDVPGVAGGRGRRDDAARDDARATRRSRSIPRTRGRRRCGAGRRSCRSSGREIPVIEDADPRRPGVRHRASSRSRPRTTRTTSRPGSGTACPPCVVIGPDGKMTAEAGEFAGLDRFEARKRDRGAARGGRPPGRDREARPQRRPLPALRHGHRAVPLDAVVREDPAAGRAGDPRRSRTARSASCPRPGRRPTSSGCATSTTGASRASSGGATASRRSRARTAT